MQVGYTEVVRESPWDDNQRAMAEALFDAEQFLMCPKCGNPRWMCSDPDQDWYPQRSTCYAKASEEIAERAWNATREGKTPDWNMKPTDGTHVWVSPHDLTPDDRFLDLL